MSDCLEPFELFLEEGRRAFTKQEHHRPSSARIEIEGKVIGSCLRAQWYAWNDIGPSNPMEVKGLFATYIGSVFENGYEEGLKKQGVNYIREYPFQADIGLKAILSGRMDFIIQGEEGDYGIELKSGYGQGMNYTKKSGLPKDNYILQMMLYLKYSGKNLTKIVNPTYARDSFFRLAHTVVANKDNTFSIEGSKGWQNIPWTCDMIIESWKKLEGFVASEKEPPRDYGEKDWQCSYCAYRDLCKGAK
jgi:hypothetical protein